MHFIYSHLDSAPADVLSADDCFEYIATHVLDGHSVDATLRDLVRPATDYDGVPHSPDELQRVEPVLENADLIQRGTSGAWRLTPQAVRRIGARAMHEIFSRLRDAGGSVGNHGVARLGSGIDQIDETRAYQFGDPALLNVQRSIMNALVREGIGTPIKLTTDDFEVYQTESQSTCSTVIMLDMSLSMIGPRFDAARIVALALDTLIRWHYPRDKLQVMAFSYFVRRLEPRMLLDTTWVESGGGTNFQEALRQARAFLAPDRHHHRQIIMVTDGEPTTYSYYQRWGPPRDDDDDTELDSLGGLGETLREVVRCTADDIDINVFLVDRQPDQSEPAFVQSMLRLNKGRAFFPSTDQLGEHVLRDYVALKGPRAG